MDPAPAAAAVVAEQQERCVVVLVGIVGPYALSTRSTAGFAPVTNRQFGPAPNRRPQAASRSGVSVTGSTDTEMNWMSGSLALSFPNVTPSGGQMVGHVVKMNWIATTLPRTRSE